MIRPLLEVQRAELRAWLADQGLAFREDDSNQNPAFARNRVRHELMPFLEREFSPAIVDVLAREAAIAAQDDERLANRCNRNREFCRLSERTRRDGPVEVARADRGRRHRSG